MLFLNRKTTPADALLPQPGLGRVDQVLEDPLPGLVVDHQVGDGVALGGGVLGVAADVEVEAGAVLQEHVGRPAPAHHPAEQVAGDLVRAQPALAAQRAGDPVLVLQAEDATIHACGSSAPALHGCCADRAIGPVMEAAEPPRTVPASERAPARYRCS